MRSSSPKFPNLRWDLCGVYKDAGMDRRAKVVRVKQVEVAGKIIRSNGLAITMRKEWLQKC